MGKFRKKVVISSSYFLFFFFSEWNIMVGIPVVILNLDGICVIEDSYIGIQVEETGPLIF
jgi:hypothetical protein